MFTLLLHFLKLTSPWKIDLPKRKVVFQPPIFRGDVNFRQGMPNQIDSTDILGGAVPDATGIKPEHIWDLCKWFKLKNLPLPFGFLQGAHMCSSRPAWTHQRCNLVLGWCLGLFLGWFGGTMLYLISSMMWRGVKHQEDLRMQSRTVV